MAESPDTERDLQALAADLKRLEAEYNMYFAGRLARPPWETRARVEALVKRYDRGRLITTGDRFRFDSLRSRYRSLLDLWERAMRAREEGRPGPFARRPPAPARKPVASRTELVHVTAFTDPIREIDKLHSLYDSLMDARRQHGEDMLPFHEFAALVRNQVSRMRAAGNTEVAFRVAVQDGKVAFTARGMKSPE